MPKFEKLDQIICNHDYAGTNGSEYDLCIKIQYKNSDKNDIILLMKVDQEETIYEGNLYREGIRASVLMNDSTSPDQIKVITKNNIMNAKNRNVVVNMISLS